MKPETSAFIDKRCAVYDIAKALGLPAPFVRRDEEKQGLYTYTFTRPRGLSLEMIRDLATNLIRMKQYPTLVAVGAEINNPNKIVLLLDPRDPQFKRDQAAQQAAKRKDSIKVAGDPKPGQRCYRAVTSCDQSFILVALKTSDAVIAIENAGHRVRTVREIDPMEYVIIALAGSSEFLNAMPADQKKG